MRRIRPLETARIDIGGYYADRSNDPALVLTSLVASLADPWPSDADVTGELPRYKNLVSQWHRWPDVVDACQRLALRLAGAG